MISIFSQPFLYTFVFTGINQMTAGCLFYVISRDGACGYG